jgi:hypothetical protein
MKDAGHTAIVAAAMGICGRAAAHNDSGAWGVSCVNPAKTVVAEVPGVRRVYSKVSFG